MDMEIIVFGVDGKCKSYTTQNPNEAYQFLKNHDHEGANTFLNLSVDMDDCYKVLESLIAK